MLALVIAGLLGVFGDVAGPVSRAAGLVVSNPSARPGHRAGQATDQLLIPSLAWPPRADAPPAAMSGRRREERRVSPEPAAPVLPAPHASVTCTMRVVSSVEDIDPGIVKPAPGREVDHAMVVRSFCED
jgi:hypothetical protein